MSWPLKAGLRELLAAERAYGLERSGGGLRFVLAFANTYQLAMSNLGFQMVYGLLARRPGIDCQRAFLPEPEALAEHHKSQTPWLTLESQGPVSQAEVIAFSLPFENDYLNLLTLLDLAGIPPRAEERGPEHPLILAGGIAPSLNPEPLADFIDLFLIGEAEEVLPDFLDLYQKEADRDRKSLLKTAASSVKGVYAPVFYNPIYDKSGLFQGFTRADDSLPVCIERRYLEAIDQPSVSPIITAETQFADRVLIELSRGCRHGCRFCAAGYTLRPPRAAPFEKLIDQIRHGAEEVGAVGLISAAVSDVVGVEELCLAALHAGAKVSVSSLRADTLTPALANILAEAGVQTLTLAPEAGSQRLRNVISKGIGESEIMEASLIALEAGIRNLRLYYMIGLPTETEDDVLEIAALTKKIISHLSSATAGKSGFNLLTLSVSSFVPKPHTPFQWAAMEPEAELNRRARLIKKALKGQKRVRVTFDRPKWAHIEALITRGDRRVGELLYLLHQSGDDLKKALKASNLNPDFYTQRQRAPDEPFPWEIVDTGVTRQYLWAEYQKALGERPSPPCFDGCDRCGVCG